MTDERLADEVAGYRPVSGLAVAALLAGGGSALVLFTSLAAVLPLLAIAMAGAALVDLRRHEGRRAGRPLALIGLALAIGFSAQAVAAAIVKERIVRGRASATARAWVDAIREERFADALSLCGPTALPLPLRESQGPPPPGGDRQAAFESLPSVAAVRGCRAASPPILLRRGSAADAWVARVVLDGCDRAGEAVTLRLGPQLVTRDGGAVERWLVTGLDVTD